MANQTKPSHQGLLVTAPPQAIYLTLSSEVTDQLVTSVFSNLNAAMNQGMAQAHILIQSSGGGITNGIAIYNYLRNIPIEINTYNGGMVSSIAVLIYLAGKTRKASETAQFMIHRAHWQSSTKPLTSVEAGMLSESLAANDARIESILHHYLKLPPEKWEIHKSYELVISAREACEWGISHAVEDFRPPPGAKVFSI